MQLAFPDGVDPLNEALLSPHLRLGREELSGAKPQLLNEVLRDLRIFRRREQVALELAQVGVGALHFGVEHTFDCLNCGNRLDPWVSQSGTPWQVTRGLRSPSYSFDVLGTVQREGGRAMRWRVWAVDRIEGEGPKSDWCVTTFSDSGLPTPGARTP